MTSDNEEKNYEPPLYSSCGSVKSTHLTKDNNNYNIQDYTTLHNKNKSSEHFSDNNGYDSDRIDPDLEELLYTSIYHQTVDTMELSFVSPITTKDTPKTNFQIDSPKKSLNDSPIESSDIFQPETKLKVSMLNKRSSAKKEVKRLKKTSAQGILPTSTPLPKMDISFCNLSMGEADTEITAADLNPFASMMTQNQFFQEDSYDTDEEDRIKAKMRKDKRFWRVDAEDLMSGFGRRSLNQPGRKSITPKRNCHFCGGFGHSVKECPRKQTCFICGSTKHSGNRCRERVCAICFEFGHQSFKCPLRYDMKVLHCSQCNQIGHSPSHCTLNWRKFLNITDPTQFEEMRNQNVIHDDTVTFNERKSCFNCGITGKHFAFECPQKTLDNLRYQIPPPVANWRNIRKGTKMTPKKKVISTPKDNLNSNMASTSISAVKKSQSTKRKLSMAVSSTPVNHYSNETRLKSSLQNKRAKSNFSKFPSSESETEVISVSSDDSSDSVQFVMSLLKNSTEINDEPINGSKNYRQSKSSKSQKAQNDHSMHLNIASGSKRVQKKEDKKYKDFKNKINNFRKKSQGNKDEPKRPNYKATKNQKLNNSKSPNSIRNSKTTSKKNLKKSSKNQQKASTSQSQKKKLPSYRNLKQRSRSKSK